MPKSTSIGGPFRSPDNWGLQNSIFGRIVKACAGCVAAHTPWRQWRREE
jgi:hypothetical protein